MKNKKLDIIKIITSLFIALIHIAPFYITLTVALKPRGDKTSFWSWPEAISLEGITRALDRGNLGTAVTNTLFITVMSVMIIVIVGAMAAYPLSRITSKTNRIVLNIIMGVMMVPAFSVLVPLYKQIVQMNGVNTFWAIILISATYNLPMSIFLYTNFIKTIPQALDEAALIDGCSKFSIFYRIIMPSLKPVTASVIILTGIGIWNDYTFQLYMLQKPSMQTITLAVSSFFAESGSYLNAAAAAALIASIPPVLAYVFLQKYFVLGVVDSGIK